MSAQKFASIHFVTSQKFEYYFWTQQKINTIPGGKTIMKNMSNVNLRSSSYVKFFNSNILRQFSSVSVIHNQLNETKM